MGTARARCDAGRGLTSRAGPVRTVPRAPRPDADLLPGAGARRARSGDRGAPDSLLPYLAEK